MFKGKKIILQPGQLITGRLAIAKQFKISESKVQRVLKTLENEQQIEQQTSNENRLITILNWSEYQNSEQQIELPVNNECTTSEQPVNTYKNVKNVRSINKEYQKKYSDDSFEMKCVNYLLQSIKTEMPNAKLPNTDQQIDKWCDSIEKMIRIDKRPNDDIYNTLVYARNDSFWKANIRSTSKLREKYETLYSQMKSKGVPRQQAVNKNKFSAFPQREYSQSDYATLEQRLLQKNQLGG
jgi:DNA-binding MarR family transcriptional regulator